MVRLYFAELRTGSNSFGELLPAQVRQSSTRFPSATFGELNYSTSMISFWEARNSTSSHWLNSVSAKRVRVRQMAVLWR